MGNQISDWPRLKVLGALALLCLGIWLLVNDLAYLRSGTRIEATVTSWHSSGRRGGSVVVTFMLDGKTRAASFHSLFSYPKGERVEVLYLPDRPGRVLRSGSWEDLPFHVLMCLAAISYLLVRVVRLRA